MEWNVLEKLFFSADQELPRILCNPKVHNPTHNSLLLAPIPSHMNTVQNLPTHLRSLLILSYLSAALSNGFFLSAYIIIRRIFPFLSHLCHMPRPSHSNITPMKLFTKHLSATPHPPQPLSSHLALCSSFTTVSRSSKRGERLFGPQPAPNVWWAEDTTLQITRTHAHTSLHRPSRKCLWVRWTQYEHRTNSNEVSAIQGAWKLHG